MQKINIPKTDLYASPLVLGTDYFGTTVSRERSMQLMDHYLDAGGNVTDTAELYTRWVTGGEHQSEKVIGEWLRNRGVRGQVILSTKGAHPRLEAMEIPRLSKADIQADLDSSLQRLGVEHVDLYCCTAMRPATPSKKFSNPSTLSDKPVKFGTAAFPTGLKLGPRKLARRRIAWEYKALWPFRICGA